MLENKSFQNPFEAIANSLEEIKSLLLGLELQPQLVQSNQSSLPQEKLLTREEVAEYLGLSKVTVWSRTKEGSLPSYKIGNAVRYKLSEIISNLHQIQRKK